MLGVGDISRQHFRIIGQNVKDWIRSSETEIVIAISVFLLTYLAFYVYRKSRSNYPPGPYGLPIVGYVPFLRKDVYLQFIELGKKYGDVFSLQLGSQNVVVLNGADVIKEAFAKPEFLGRPPENAFNILEKSSPFFVSGIHVWTEHRRFVVQSMKDLGLGKSRIEGQIQDEINDFLKVLLSYKGKAADPRIPLTPSMSNNICALVFDERYDYEDPERKTLDANLLLSSEILAQTSSHIFFPWLRRIPFFVKWMNLEKGKKAFKETESIFWKKIKQHEQTLDPKNPRDYIDCYLIEMKNRKENNRNTTLSDKAFIGSVTDLFGAGSETVRTTILWCIYVMAAFPDVQRKVQKEIMNQLGPDRSAEFMDMKMMPYTHAVIMEVMRWKTILPLNILRYTTGDATIRGYSIPKGTTVMANFWAAHHDPEIWPEPEVFKPERFLTEDGKSVRKSPNFMPFSVGKRACPGETMANIEVFLYFVSIFQKFDVTFPEGVHPTFDAELAVTYRLNSYLINFTPKE